DDRTYLGVALDNFQGDLVGMDSLLVFHAYGVDAVLNKAAGGALVTPPVAKLNWSTFNSTGMNLTAALGHLNGTPLGALTQGTDLKAGGGVSLDILGFVVGKANF